MSFGKVITIFFNDGAKAEAREVEPIDGVCVYEISFSGLDPSREEKIDGLSISGRETLPFNFKIKSEGKIMHMPGTLREQAGLNRTTFRRDTGDYVEFYLPWRKY